MKKRRGYLKHFNDATSGITIQSLLMRKQPYAVLLHWYILERCNQLGSSSISISLNELRFRMHRRSDALLKDISALSEESQNLSFTLVGDKLEISVSNYAEYQESRGGKRDVKTETKSDTLKIKDKRLEIKDKKYIKKKSSRAQKASPFERDIEALYFQYPRKEGKTRGLAKLTKDIKCDEDLLDLEKAIENYAKATVDKERQYIKLFSSFATEWRDWIDWTNEDEIPEFIPEEFRDVAK